MYTTSNKPLLKKINMWEELNNTITNLICKINVKFHFHQFIN